MSPLLVLTLLAIAMLGVAGLLFAARGDLDRVAGWLLVGGWFLFALTSPTFQFPVVLRPLGLAVGSTGAVLARLGDDRPDRNRSELLSPASRLMFVFVTFVLIGCLASPEGPGNLVRGIEGVLIVVTATYGVALGFGGWLVGAVLAASFANVVLSIISGAPEVVPGVEGDPTRLSGFMQPNHLAYAAALVLIGVAALWGRHQRARLALVVVASTATYALLASRSRTGLIALILALVIAGAASVAPAARLRAAAVGLVVVLAVVPVLGSAGHGWFDRDSGTDSNISSLTGRTDLWPPVIDLIEERPVVGWGIDAVLSPAGIKVQEVLPGVGQAHNAYLEAALMGGVPAAAAWGLSLLAALIGSFRLPRSDPHRFGLIATGVLLQLYAITESSPAWFGDMFICYVLLIAVQAEARAAHLPTAPLAPEAAGPRTRPAALVVTAAGAPR
jgi:O-antigen ligase